jgi:uncharacterized protein
MAIKFINGIKIKKHLQDNGENRSVEIDVSEDDVNAFITISYKKLEDIHTNNTEENTNVKVKLYTISEIKDALQRMKIVHGIIEENLAKCINENGITELLIAQGVVPEDDVHDTIKVNFEETKSNEFKVDEHGSVDYRSIGAVNTVNKGDIIAVKVIGKVGIDGIDVYGNQKPRKRKKKVFLKAGEGCGLKEDDSIEALISGEPYAKGNSFYVYGVHTINKDVSLETGDIDFIGDIKIFGNVQEGMTVNSGNSITIEGNVENAKIIALGNVSIMGNVIMANINAGGDDIKISKYIQDLEETKGIIDSLVEMVMSIKNARNLKENISDGELIKLLIETKFKSLIQLCWSTMKESYEFSNGEIDPVSNIIRGKLIGAAPLQIKHFGELDGIVEKIEERLEELGKLLALPVNVRLSYCQDTTINSSGDVSFVGPGQYVSHINSGRSINFIPDNSVARGGVLRAKEDINCKIVGSNGGVETRLCVERTGNIKIDFAFQNTILTVGKREYVIDKPSYSIHAFMNSDKELVVNKFVK